jgi:hypothetical protein
LKVKGAVRVKVMRRLRIGMAVVAVCLTTLAALAPLAAADDGLWRMFRGRVVFSDVALAAASNFESTAQMTSALRRIERSAFDQTAGFWRLHILAFLDRPAPASTLVLRASDASDPRAPRPVRVFEVPIERGERELRLDDFVVTPAMGFAPGGSYEFAIEAPGDAGAAAAETDKAGKAGKADVYAKGVITLR